MIVPVSLLEACVQLEDGETIYFLKEEHCLVFAPDPVRGALSTYVTLCTVHVHR